jgi:hypothetical protein
MILSVEQPIALACVFIWIGFVCAISFMEAWLKFRAPGVTLPVGLSIGRLVFKALNRIEWVFAAIIILSSAVYSNYLLTPGNIYLLVALAVLITQTLWLLPAMDARAVRHLNAQALEPSCLHIYFIAVEVLKVLCLGAAGISMFNAG